MPVAVFFLFVVTIPLPGNAYVSEGLRLMVANRRPLLVGAVVGIALLTAFAYRGRRFARYLHRTDWPRLFVLGAIFPFYYLCAATLKGDLRLQATIMYVMWTIFVFVCIPLMVTTKRELMRMFRVVMFANVLCWLIPFMLSFTGAPAYVRFDQVNSYGYLNPNFYAKILQVFFIIALFGYMRRRHTRLSKRRATMLLAVLVLSAFGVMAVAARNVLVFMLVAVVCSFVIRSGRHTLLRALSLMVVSAVCGVLVIQYVGASRVDEYSSGRVSIWESQLSKSWKTQPSVKAILIGPDTLPVFEEDGGYDPVKQGKVYSKFHIDNVYLEFYFESGLFGLFLFFLPYGLVLTRAASRWKKGGDPASRWTVCVLIGLGAQSTLTTTIPTFGNPLAPLFALLLVVGWRGMGALEEAPRGR